ncbi:MAG TPA: hypothetical protein VJO16_01115 [Candidatus Acidoferrum sp.]|nr:hypothetical protein [Candidatus Acidoferrum sp.]
MKSALQLGLIALLAAAVYYRLARHDAGKYYILFGAWVVILFIYVFRYGKKEAEHYFSVCSFCRFRRVC